MKNCADKVKTINIITKTWFDKVNGNTYFAQSITINQFYKNELTIFNDFQYGYSSFIHYALQRLAEYLGCEVSDIKTKKIENITIRNCKKIELNKSYFYSSIY